MSKIIFIAIIICISFQFTEAQWIQQNSGTNQNLYDIEFINDKTGWALGDAGIVIKTTNGGKDWINIPNPSPAISPNLWSVAPIDSNIVYITSSGDFIMKSTNGGMNWDILHSCHDCNSSFIGVYFLNKDTGWTIGSYKVFRTFNGGITFDSFYVPWFTNLDLYFKDINTGIMSGTGKVFKTTDSGENWFDTNVPTNGTFYFFERLGIYQNNVWLTADHLVFRSTNFCDTWQRIEFTDFPGGRAINFVNKDTGYIGSGLNAVFRSTNSGYNWTQQRTDSSVLAFISSMTFIDDMTGWYVGGIGKTFKTTNGGEVITSVNDPNVIIPTEFKLLQNYPNPFNNETNFEFDITDNSIYKMEIYNLLGVKLEEFFNKYFDSGNYKMTYDAKNLSSGIYIYKLSSQRYSLSKIFVLLK